MKIRIVAEDDSIWAQTIGRIFLGLVDMMVGIIWTCIYIVVIPICLVWLAIESVMNLWNDNYSNKKK